MGSKAGTHKATGELKSQPKIATRVAMANEKPLKRNNDLQFEAELWDAAWTDGTQPLDLVPRVATRRG